MNESDKSSAPAFPDAAATRNSRFSQDQYIFGCGGTPHRAARSARTTVADGEGRNSVWLAQQGLSVDAFDIADVDVAKARKLAADVGAKAAYEVADCDGLQWPAAIYDGVAAIFVQFAGRAMRRRLFFNFIRCQKPGGVLVLQGYTLKQLDTAPAVLRRSPICTPRRCCTPNSMRSTSLN
ncbi:MAG TPA: class I SAM-dependent methyltransferase [Noviherbaspirillum sp.]|nr:class I SAM-dependent methyltransferase [Noviherbaspirillum sp.]